MGDETKTCRLAVVGAGLIGRRHIETIAAAPACRLAAVIDPAPGAETIAQAHGATYWTDLEPALHAGGLDGAIIATPNILHHDQGMMCLEHGIPVLIEKPLAHDMKSAADLVEASQRTGVPVLVGHHRRHNPWVAAAKKHLDDGSLGRLVAAHASCWLMKPAEYFDQNWRRRPGGGPLAINLIHDIDLLRHLCGEFLEVQALASAGVRRFDVEDSAVVNARLAGGGLLTITLSDTISAPWSYELTANENPAYSATGQSCYWLGGTHGSLQLPDGVFWDHAGRRSWWEPMRRSDWVIPHADPLPLQIAHFHDVIEGRASPLVPAEEGWRNMQILDAIQKAVVTGRTQRLDQH